MNKTKKLTQGAMMLAIMGAVILLDRMLGYAFSDIAILIVPVVIIMYSAMHTFKDGLLLSVGVVIITFILANFQLTYLLYVPAGIFTGIAFSYGMSKGLDKRTLTVAAVIVYIACEIIIAFVVYPLLGFPLSNYIVEYKQLMTDAGFNFSDMLKGFNFDVNNIIVIIYIITTIVMGVMEGILISLLSIFLLKRFKIKDLGNMNLLEIKPNPILAYACMICLISFTFIPSIKNEIISYILITICIIGALILVYYGYIFVTLYGTLVLKKRISSFVILLGFFIPAIFLILIVLGFLYAAGPLRRKLEEKINIRYE